MISNILIFILIIYILYLCYRKYSNYYSVKKITNLTGIQSANMTCIDYTEDEISNIRNDLSRNLSYLQKSWNDNQKQISSLNEIEKMTLTTAYNNTVNNINEFMSPNKIIGDKTLEL